jgi:hypothetical protein
MRLMGIALILMMRPAGIAAAGLGMLLLSAMASVAVRAAEPAQQTFSSPEQAVAALAEAWGHEDKAALLKIFGARGAN